MKKTILLSLAVFLSMVCFIQTGVFSQQKNKKILVVYYSRTGNTKRVAEDLASRLKADTEIVTDRKNREGVKGFLAGGRDATMKKLTEIENTRFDPSKYDLTIIGTPVWSWNMTPAIRTYITKNRGLFKEVAFFTTSGSTKPEKIVPGMEELAGKKAVAFTGFNQKELKPGSKDIYEQKISAFVSSLK